MKFPFKSKLERHLQSDDHKMFTESVQASMMLIDDDYEDFCIETHPKEVCSLGYDQGFILVWRASSVEGLARQTEVLYFEGMGHVSVPGFSMPH